MICNVCGGPLYVVDVASGKHDVTRKRRCKKCGALMWTVERETDPHLGRIAIGRNRAKYRKLKSLRA